MSDLLEVQLLGLIKTLKCRDQTQRFWLSIISRIKAKKLEDLLAQKLTKTSRRRSLNRCKSTCVTVLDYWKYSLAATEYSECTL